MTIEEDTRIVDNSTRVRLAELDVEKTKINANAEIRKQRVSAFNNIGSTSGLIVIFVAVLLLLARGFQCNLDHELEKTKRLPELTLQKIEKNMKQLKVIRKTHKTA